MSGKAPMGYRYSPPMPRPKRQATDEEAATLILMLVLGWPIRIAMSSWTMTYLMTFWLTYLHRPNAWLWWHGAALAFLPGIFFRWFIRTAVMAAIATFVASYFI